MKLLDFSSRSGLAAVLMLCALLILGGMFISHLKVADQWVKVAGMMLQMMAAIALLVIGLMLKSLITSGDLLLAAQKTAEQEDRVRRAFASMIPKEYRFRDLGWLGKTIYIVGIFAGLATVAFGIAMPFKAVSNFSSLPEKGKIFLIFLSLTTICVGLAVALMTHVLVRYRTLDRYDEMKREIFREFGIE